MPEEEECMDTTEHPSHKQTAKEEGIDFLTEVESGEEVFINSQDPADGDIPLEPFNLDEEREFGTFGEDGFYVENRKERADAADAWLSSSEAVVCSIDVLRKHQEQQEALSATEAAPKPSISQTLDLMRKIVMFLQPRETVLAALRRLAKKDPSKDAAKPDMKKFEELTELADALLNSGEMDAYSMYKEEFEHSMQTMGSGKQESLQNEVNASNDMFAEESDHEEEDNAKQPTSQKEELTTMIEPQAQLPSVSKKAEMELDFALWPISELKRFLSERNIDWHKVVEKGELVEKAKQAYQSTGHSASYQAPEGFVFHPQSGYFYNEERGFYYDGASRCFYDPRTIKWYDEHWNELKQN